MSTVAPYPGYDLRGATVGEAKVIKPISKGEGRGVVWKVVCPCGAVQHRTTSQITFARDMSQRILCPECVKEARVARGLTRQDRRIEVFYSAIRRINPAILESPEKLRSILATLLQKYGLYALGYNDREEAALREEIHEAIGAPVEALLKVPEAAPSWEGTEDDALDWSNFYPMLAPDGHGLHCAHCDEDRDRGWGCIRCMKFSCRACLSTRHQCHMATPIGWQTDGASLDVVGEEINQSRERVRQIEGHAIRHFAEKWRAEESRAEAVAVRARMKVLRQLPDIEIQEKTQAINEAIVAAEMGRRALRQSALDSASVDEILEGLRWQVNRKIILARGAALPWDLKHPSAHARLFDGIVGDSVAACKTLDGLVSCSSCRKIVLHGSAESATHQSRGGTRA
jgi:hypothetical protein